MKFYNKLKIFFENRYSEAVTEEYSTAKKELKRKAEIENEIKINSISSVNVFTEKTTEYEIQLVKSVIVNKISEQTFKIIIYTTSALIFLGIIFILPRTYNYGDNGIGLNILKSISGIKWIILGIISSLLVSLILKKRNKKLLFGKLKFEKNYIIESWGTKINRIKIEDVEYIEYLCSNIPEVENELSEEIHWIKITTKNYEVNSEFRGKNIQLIVLNILRDYKKSGINIKIETIN